ncbi:FecR family protein [Butyricimonas paravirosa]
MNDYFIHKWEQLTSLWHVSKKGDTDELSNIPELKRMLKNQFEIRQAMARLEQHHYDIEKGWRRVRPFSSRERVLQVAKYAAVLFLVLFMAYWGVRQGRQEEKVASNQCVIASGRHQAKLKLATGKLLSLDVQRDIYKVEANGVEITNDTLTGKVYYKVTKEGEEFTPAFNTLVVPKGGEYSLELQDGTVIWVNSESSLRFPEKFAKDRREVYLTGEAYFKVAKDLEKPFCVHTELGAVCVLGTSFNVSAYPDDRLWRTTLVEGSVMIQRGKDEIVMKPNEQYQIDMANGEGVLKSVVPELYTSWVNGKFYFKGYTFEELVKKLERWYDFQMFYVNEDIKYRRFSGVVNKHQPLQEMLKYLEMTSDVRFKVEGMTVTASRVFDQ